ncbi:thioredoxin family protein [Aliikangiella coralliicola]|uniref:Thioredoxin family protein n=1 Tax=Aliikangiella coralliicola TaxID=2592383 RepID=A0A545U679_9GAMM|nr:thioredoxin family protein [Aliikangiella coralliicola]TQV84966.1 thioredoxin family protein [Aliikangiella coralliicola]
MSLTPSNMMPLGSIAPDFNLLNVVNGKLEKLEQLRGKQGTLIMFICNHCPFVIHIEKALASLGEDYANSGLSIIAISSNSVESHPQDGPQHMAQKAAESGFKFPYLYDETQSVAKAYQAACTPDLFLFDDKLACVYRGQFDDSRPGNNIPVTGKDIRQAIENLLAGMPISDEQKPSIGCNIKWK